MFTLGVAFGMLSTMAGSRNDHASNLTINHTSGPELSLMAGPPLRFGARIAAFVFALS
jgi:hypothetical protein